VSSIINDTIAANGLLTGHRSRWLFLGLLLLAAALRFFDVGARDIWLDEAFSWNQATLSFTDMFASVSRDVHPPLYQLILWLNTRLFGDSAFALRLPSVVFSLIAVALTYRLTTIISSKPAALLAMAFATVSTFQLWYAQEARMYALLAMLAVGSMLMLVQLLQQPNRRNTAGYIVLSLLLLYTHIYGAFILIAQNLFYLLLWGWRQTPGQLPWHRWLLLQVLIGLGFLPWFLILLKQISTVQNNFWIAEPGLLALLNTLLTYQSLPFLLFMLSIAIIGLGLWKGQVNTLIEHGPASRKLNNALLLCWLCVPLLIPFLLSQFMQPIYMTRYTIAAAFPWYILIAIGICSLPRLPAIVWASVVVGAALINLPAYYGDRSAQTHWSSIAAYVESNASPDATLLFHADYGSLPYLYYGDLSGLFVLTIDSGFDPALEGISLDQLSIELINRDDVWLVESYVGKLPITEADVLATVALTHSETEVQLFGPVKLRRFSLNVK
jgi:uncharacterized membrane protein